MVRDVETKLKIDQLPFQKLAMLDELRLNSSDFVSIASPILYYFRQWSPI